MGTAVFVREFDPQRSDLSEESCLVYSKFIGGRLAVPVITLQGLHDCVRLDPFQRFPLAPRPSRSNLGWTQLGRKVVRFDYLPLAENECVFDNVFQFPDISRIIVVGQDLLGFRGQTTNVFAL